jgi:hypothetical protein
MRGDEETHPASASGSMKREKILAWCIAANPRGNEHEIRFMTVGLKWLIPG